MSGLVEHRGFTNKHSMLVVLTGTQLERPMKEESCIPINFEQYEVSIQALFRLGMDSLNRRPIQPGKLGFADCTK